ncbi:MAG: hypothetical protein R3E79_42765 [Caldilineaceae bacterium]
MAANQGVVASLAPKPKPDQAGNGCHIHWSLWDLAGEQNLLYDPHDRFLLSQLGYHFIAGVLAHLPGLLALTTPSYNSFRRLQPHFWSSAYTAWGRTIAKPRCAWRRAPGARRRPRSTSNSKPAMPAVIPTWRWAG